MTIKDGVKFGIGFILAEGIMYAIVRAVNDALNIYEKAKEENTDQEKDSTSES